MVRRVTWDDEGLVRAIDAIPKRVNAFIYASARYHAQRGQTYARQNASWTDRTSNARNGLFGKAIRNGNTTAIVIGGTVTYQPWLEVRFSGRYAIIGPTIRHEGPEFMRTLSRGFDVIFGGSS